MTVTIAAAGWHGLPQSALLERSPVAATPPTVRP